MNNDKLCGLQVLTGPLQLSLSSLDDNNKLVREIKLPNPETPGTLKVFAQFFLTSAGHVSYRALIVSAGGTWHMYQSDMLLWNRHESLSSVAEVWHRTCVSK